MAREQIRADAVELLRRCGHSPQHSPSGPHRHLLRNVMQQLWNRATRQPMPPVILDGLAWRSMPRTEREVLWAQWQDGLEVEIEAIVGDPCSRRPVFNW
ncbi:MAG: hypothetical protein JNK45_25110 [Myxococcales bacterium]|nr:hypothetical protein [Myxococcales bacterium]